MDLLNVITILVGHTPAIPSCFGFLVILLKILDRVLKGFQNSSRKLIIK